MSVYFAYGSNMSSARLLARVSGAAALGRAHVSGWSLRFNKRGRDGTGKANLVPAPGALCWGVAWTLPDDAWPRLDRFEPGYERHTFRLQRSAGDEIDAQAYLHACPPAAPSIAPSDTYLDHLLNGALEHDLPDDYVAKIRSFAKPS